MAIKVNGTTVVDDSRNLTNIASVDATTVAALSAAGVGDITAVTAGSGLTGGGTSGAVTINHQDTSSQGSVNNSGNTVIQDITLDTYGHITGINSTTVSAGASTTFNAVGTYCLAGATSYSNRTGGQTRAGSGLRRANTYAASGNSNGTSGSSLSGSWRIMGNTGYFNGGGGGGAGNTQVSLWVRYA